MPITIESPHLKLGKKLEEQVYAKFDHLQKLYNRIEECEVVFRKIKNDQQKNYSIEAKVLVPKKMLFASEQEESFEIALFKLIEDLEQQLRRHKERMAAI